MARGMAAALLLMGAGAAHAQALDPSVGRDAIQIQRMLQCSTVDGEPALFHWTGRVYSRVPGERDRHLFNVEGMNVRQCGSVPADPKRGQGYRMVSREIMLYTDPQTGEVLRRWENPWTEEAVEVVHVANDPVNMREPSYERGADGQPYSLPLRVAGDRVFYNIEVPLFYPNPLGGDYQQYVGNQYQAMEIFDFIADADRVFDRKGSQVYPAVAWVRLAPWLPWMEMGSRPGMMVFNATGQKVRGYDDLPQVLQREIKANYPAYTAPPPLDDKRPNETSWTYFKKRVDARRAQGEGAAPPR